MLYIFYVLKLEDVHFAYEERVILKGVSLRVEPGEILALIGTSGSGKTTLFRLITGLIQPDQGQIIASSELTYMQQEDLLLPWRTVLQNVLLPFELGGAKQLPLMQAHQLLNLVGLEGYAEAYPQELSGGMRQRVSLARALLQDRPMVLLDEPFGSLDVLIREQLYLLLKQTKKTILLVTHDFRDALELADRILVLSDGQIVENLTVAGSNPQKIKETIRDSLQAKSAPALSSWDERREMAL